MKNRYRSTAKVSCLKVWKFWISLGLLALVTTACGGFTGPGKNKDRLASAAAQSGSRSHGLALMLKPEILPPFSEGEGHRPAALGTVLPAQGKERFTNHLMLSEKDSIQLLSFGENIHVPASGELFLSWSGKAFGSPIVNAYYGYERATGQPSRVVDQKIRDLVKSDEQGQWFIPILSGTGKRAHDFAVADTHSFDLEIHLADGRIIRVRVKMRLYGPLPQIRAETIRKLDPGSLSAREAGGVLVNGGLPAAIETFVNPTQRAFTLWVSSRLQSGSVFNAQVVHRKWAVSQPAPNRGFVYEDPARHRITGLLRVAELRVVRVSGVQSIPIDPAQENAWMPVSLGAGEKVDIHFMLKAGPGDGGCGLPSAFTQELRWQERHRTGHGGRGGDGYDTWLEDKVEHRTNEWVIESAGYRLQFQPEFRLSDEAASRKEVFEFSDEEGYRSRVLDRGPAVNLDTDLSRPAYPGCQGFIL